jgi:hypothetical protein
MTAGASQCPSCPVCVRDSSIWPGRKKGAADTVKRKRRGKTPGEVAATVAKKTAKEEKARKDKARKEKAARCALVATLRKGREKDGGEGPSVPMAAADGTAAPSLAASHGAQSSVGPSHPAPTGFALCSISPPALLLSHPSLPDPHLAAYVGWEGRW